MGNAYGVRGGEHHAGTIRTIGSDRDPGLTRHRAISLGKQGRRNCLRPDGDHFDAVNLTRHDQPAGRLRIRGP